MAAKGEEQDHYSPGESGHGVEVEPLSRASERGLPINNPGNLSPPPPYNQLAPQPPPPPSSKTANDSQPNGERGENYSNKNIRLQPPSHPQSAPTANGGGGGGGGGHYDDDDKDARQQVAVITERDEGDLQGSSSDPEEGRRQQQQQQTGTKKYKLSPLRWPTLIGFCTLGFCNGISNEHSSILNVYTQTLDIDLADYVLLNQIFFFVPFVTSFISAVLIDRFGSKLAIYITLWVAGVRNSSRAMLFWRESTGWQELKYVYWAMQRLFTSLTIGLYFCLPLKLSENWFPEEERSLALSMCAVLPILGSAVAAIIYPRYILDADTATPLAWINAGAFLVSVVAIFGGVRRSQPAEGAPSERSQMNLDKRRERAERGQEEESLWEQLAKVSRHPDLMIQLVAVSNFDSSLIVINTILQDIMTSAGMSRVFTGQFMAFSSVLAAVIQLSVSSWLRPAGSTAAAKGGGGGGGSQQVDPYNTRKCKLLLTAKCVTFMAFAMSLTLRELFGPSAWLERNQWWLIVCSSISYIMTRYCAAPYFNEQLAEIIRGSVSEATTSACQAATTNVLYHSLLFIFVQLRSQPENEGLVGAASELTQNNNTTTATMIHNAIINNVVDLEGAASAGSEEEILVVMEPARYLRSSLLLCTMALTTTCLYLLKFDSNPHKRRQRLESAAIKWDNKLRQQNGAAAAAAAGGGGGGGGSGVPVNLKTSESTIEMIEIDTKGKEEGEETKKKTTTKQQQQQQKHEQVNQNLS